MMVGVDVRAIDHRDPSGHRAKCLHAGTGSRSKRADVDEVPIQRGGRGHLRADEVGPTAPPLPALEVPVGRRSAALARREDVGVHAEAHRAAGEPPLEDRVEEDLVESLLLRLAANLC